MDFDNNDVLGYFFDDDNPIAEESFNEEILLENAQFNAEVFLSALRNECNSQEEFANLVIENAVDWEVYGIIPSNYAEKAIESAKIILKDSTLDELDIATEARNIVKLNKKTKLDALAKKTAIDMGEAKNDPDWIQYNKHRRLMIQFRQKLFDKYLTRATPVAKKSLFNSKKKAALIKSTDGKGIVNKIDNQIKKIDKNARNHSAISEAKGT